VEVVGTAADGRAVLDLVRRAKPDLLFRSDADSVRSPAGHGGADDTDGPSKYED
jgi:hypothetical protein